MLTKKKDDSFIDLREKQDTTSLACEAPKMSAPVPPKGPTFYVRGVKLPLTSEDVMKVKTAKIQYRVRNVEDGVNCENERRNSYEIEVIGFEGT